MNDPITLAKQLVAAAGRTVRTAIWPPYSSWMVEPSVAAATVRLDSDRLEMIKPTVVRVPGDYPYAWEEVEDYLPTEGLLLPEVLVAPTPLEPLVSICRRITLAMFRIERAYPKVSDVVAWTREAFQDALGQLALLDLEAAWDGAASEALSQQALEIVLDLNKRVTADDGLAGPMGIDMSRTVEALFWPASAMFGDGVPPIPPDELERLVRGVIEALERALDDLAREAAGNPKKEQAVKEGRRLLQILRANGQNLVSTARQLPRGYPWGNFMHWLQRTMAGAMQHFGRFLSQERLAALFRAILNLGRAAAPGGGGAAGAAYVPWLLWITLVILAAYGGWKLGRLIGSTTVGDQTVDEHIVDFLFMGSPFFESGTVPEFCKEAFERFLAAWERRREFEAMGGPKSLILHHLEEEIEMLKFIIENRCDEKPGRWSRLRSERMRLRDELQRN